MVLSHHLSDLAPEDVGVSHGDLFRRICWVLRAIVFLLLILSPLSHLGMLVLGYIEADARENLWVLGTGLSLGAIGVYGRAKSKPYLFEINAHYVLACVSFFAMSAQQICNPTQLELLDFIGMVMMRPLGSMVMISINTILKVGGSQWSSDPLWILTCITLNGSTVWKCLQDMPTLLPLLISAAADQAFVAFLLNITTTALLKERDALNCVREVLQQNLDAQESMWKSVFDATCLLDSSGLVARASPQALDLLLVDPQDSLAGVPLSSLASSEEEGKRVDEFLKKAMDCPSNQAFTIQTTLRGSSGSSIDIQVNAVRVIKDMRELRSPAASGILLGMRSLGLACSSSTKEEPCRHSASDSYASSSEDPEQNPEMFVHFDAGSKGFQVWECSPELWKMEPQLLDWVSGARRGGLERWILDEVDLASEDGSWSSEVAQNLKFRIQPKPLTVLVEKARLQTLPADFNEDGSVAFPAKLWLHGVRMQRPLQLSYHAEEAKALPPLAEEMSGGVDSDAIDAESVVSDIAPSDSASQLNGVLLRKAPPLISGNIACASASELSCSDMTLRSRRSHIADNM